MMSKIDAELKTTPTGNHSKWAKVFKQNLPNKAPTRLIFTKTTAYIEA